MLLTDDFVFIHPPKTGGTFVTSMLERVYRYRKPRTVLQKVISGLTRPRVVRTNKHGNCASIPTSHRGRPILGVIRSPWSQYVSEYHFGWWKENLSKRIDRARAVREFPDFPELSFAEYIRFANEYQGQLLRLREGPGNAPGYMTRRFAHFFFVDGGAGVSRMDSGYIEREGWKEDMFPVRFLRQHRLNGDLHAFLQEMGHRPEDISFILDHGNVLPRTPSLGSRADRHWSEYWTPDLEEYVRDSERVLFSIFPDLPREARAGSTNPLVAPGGAAPGTS